MTVAPRTLHGVGARKFRMRNSSGSAAMHESSIRALSGLAVAAAATQSSVASTASRGRQLPMWKRDLDMGVEIEVSNEGSV